MTEQDVKKYTELEMLQNMQALVESIICELGECKNLMQAKKRLNGYSMVMTTSIAVESCNAKELLSTIQKLVETDPHEAVQFAIHGHREI